MFATQGATFANWSSFLDLYYGATTTRYPSLAKPAGLTDLITQSLQSPDYATQKKLAQQAVQMILDNCTAIPLFVQSETYIMNDKVHDTHFNYMAESGFRWSVTTAWMSK